MNKAQNHNICSNNFVYIQCFPAVSRPGSKVGANGDDRRSAEHCGHATGDDTENA